MHETLICGRVAWPNVPIAGQHKHDMSKRKPLLFFDVNDPARHALVFFKIILCTYYKCHVYINKPIKFSFFSANVTEKVGHLLTVIKLRPLFSPKLTYGMRVKKIQKNNG